MSWTWGGSVSCEGGPLLIADARAYGRWLGAIPFASLRKARPDDPRGRTGSNVLHYWGELAAQLPGPFLELGGHRLDRYPSRAEASAKLAELVTVIRAKWPQARIGDVEATLRGEETLDVTLPHGPTLQAQLSPKSEYDAALQTHEGASVWTQAVGAGSGLFWDLDAGTAHLGATDGQLVLVRWRLTGQDDRAEATALRRHIETRHDGETRCGQLEITTPTLFAVWSRVARCMLKGAVACTEHYEASVREQLDAASRRGIGLVQPVVPGRYAVSLGSTQGTAASRTWSGRWCRLTRIA